MVGDDDSLKGAIDKYTRWLDDQIANVDQSVDQEANHNKSYRVNPPYVHPKIEYFIDCSLRLYRTDL